MHVMGVYSRARVESKVAGEVPRERLEALGGVPLDQDARQACLGERDLGLGPDGSDYELLCGFRRRKDAV